MDDHMGHEMPMPATCKMNVSSLRLKGNRNLTNERACRCCLTGK